MTAKKTVRKTQENNTSVKDFIAAVKNKRRKEDSLVVLKIMKDISGKRPKMWGPSIIGFGKHRYKYANGKDAEICKIGFSPRASSLVFYLGNFEEQSKLLGKLGKHKLSGGGCLYINKLENIDIEVLQDIIKSAYST